MGALFRIRKERVILKTFQKDFLERLTKISLKNWFEFWGSATCQPKFLLSNTLIVLLFSGKEPFNFFDQLEGIDSLLNV